MKLRFNSALKGAVLGAAMVMAGSASAQSEGQYTAKVGFGRITPKVDSGDVSAPALPGTKAAVSADTKPIFSFA